MKAINLPYSKWLRRIRQAEKFMGSRSYSSIDSSLTPILRTTINRPDFTLQMLGNKRATIITHLAGWLIFIGLPMLLLYGLPGYENIFATLLIPGHLIFYGTFIFLYYFNAYFLVPHLYFQKKYFLFFFIIFLMLALFSFLKPFEELIVLRTPHFYPFMNGPIPGSIPIPGSSSGLPPFAERKPPAPIRGPFGNFDPMSIILFIMTIALGLAERISRQLRLTVQRVAKAETAKTSAELAFLKAQINPHFLFNTLNNIYTLAIIKNEHTAESIMKLSNIMRYVTDDINDDFVSHQSEVDCISDFIDLQRLRLGRKVNGRID